VYKLTDEHDKKDDVKIDFTKIRNFFTPKNLNILILLLLILIPVALTVYIRVLPQYLPATDDMSRNAVYNYYKNGIAQNINAQYPNLPVVQRQKLVDEQFAGFLKTNEAYVEQQVMQTSNYFKTGFQYQENNNTYTFLGDLDSYYYLNQARNIERNGVVCDKIENNICIDTKMIAPIGTPVGATMHPYGIFVLYKFLHFFDSKINLMQAQFYLPTLLAVIGAIAAFFIGRKLMNEVGGFFAAMLFALSPLLISRSLGSDTDIWNVVFPLVIIWIFLEAYDARNTLNKILLGGLTGLLMGLFSFAWGGYWYIFLFMLLAIIGHIGFIIVKDYMHHKRIHFWKEKHIQQELILFASIFVFSAIFVSLFAGSIGAFFGVFMTPFTVNANLKVAAQAELWPNIMTTVAELNEGNVATTVGQIGFGIPILFAISLLGIIFLLVGKKPTTKEYILLIIAIIVYAILTSSIGYGMNPTVYTIVLLIPIALGILNILLDKDSKHDIKIPLILGIWYVFMIYASIKGIRFNLLLIPAFSVALGVAIGYIYEYISRLFHEGLNVKENISKLIVFALLCLILIIPIQAGIATGKSYMPSMTIGWWDSLTKIREESKPDAIINSWWDFGHWFKYVAERKVTADGSAQSGPFVQYLAQTLTTSDEKRATGLLRILDCGSTTGFDEMNKKYNDTERTQNIVDEIVIQDKTQARKTLEIYGYTSSEIDKILLLTHCNPPENYFITSEDMVGKAGVWAHFGTWDFDKAFIINNVRTKPYDEAMKIMEERFKERSSFFQYSADEASRIYYEVQALQTDREMNDWISTWPSYATGSLIGCVNYTKDLVLCDLNLGIGSNGQQNIVLQRAAINLTNPESSQVLIGIYDKATNSKVGENVAFWKSLVIADEEMKRYDVDNTTMNLGLLLNIDRSNNQTRYSALISDPILLESTFTKLFYLDGKYMNNFEKFSDVTDITGTRIIIWKVKWPVNS
jgi:dolichyl-diphosphooligosaccharide--protein glycosyltransferase